MAKKKSPGPYEISEEKYRSRHKKGPRGMGLWAFGDTHGKMLFWASDHAIPYSMAAGQAMERLTAMNYPPRRKVCVMPWSVPCKK